MSDFPEPPSISLTDEMVRYYDARAPQYDASMQYDNAEVVSRHMALAQVIKRWFADRSVLEIACGPGFWTSHFAPDARRVLATDVNESTLAEARKKTYPPGRVAFAVADAYALGQLETGATSDSEMNITGDGFDAAFAGDWWSHIPKGRVADFLACLTQRLAPGARVAFVDQLPNERSYREGSRHDMEGNHIQQRHLPGTNWGSIRDAQGQGEGESGMQSYSVIKNFPTETELRAAVAPFASGAEGAVTYQTFPECRRWLLCFTLP